MCVFEDAGRKIKPMHGVGQPPILGGPEGVGPQLFHYLEEAGIPYEISLEEAAKKAVELCEEIKAQEAK